MLVHSWSMDRVCRLLSYIFLLTLSQIELIHGLICSVLIEAWALSGYRVAPVMTVVTKAHQ